MSTAITTRPDSGHRQEGTLVAPPRRNRQYQIAAVALLFAWQILTVIGGYFYIAHTDHSIVAISGLALTAGNARGAFEVTKSASGDQDLPKPIAADLRAKLNQNSADLKAVSQRGYRLAFALVIGWLLMSVMSGHVAFRLLRLANSDASK